MFFRYNGYCVFDFEVYGRSACKKLETKANVKTVQETSDIKVEEMEVKEEEEEAEVYGRSACKKHETEAYVKTLKDVSYIKEQGVEEEEEDKGHKKDPKRKSFKKLGKKSKHYGKVLSWQNYTYPLVYMKYQCPL